MKYILLILFPLLFLNCKPDVKQEVFDTSTPQITSEKDSAQYIIDNSIKVSGGDVIANSTIEFDFRDKHYRAVRNAGEFFLERSFMDSSLQNFDSISKITDGVNNDGFIRLVNGFPMAVHDSMAVKYTASVNSVHYFSVLPYGLNDKAVNKELLPSTKIGDKHYQTIKVTFNEDGGGEDFEDVFLYWIDMETYKIDYLAYSYNELDGKGMRFREAYNERFVNGVRFVDYNNYKPTDKSIKLINLPQNFNNGTLELLSKIELENISVTLI